MIGRLTSVLLGCTAVGAVCVAAKAQPASQQMIIESVPDAEVREALEDAFGGNAPALPEGFLIPSEEPDPNRIFRPMAVAQTEEAETGAGIEEQPAMALAPEINVLGTDQVETYQGEVELFETVAGHLIARVEGQDLAFEIKLPGTSETGSGVTPLLPVDPTAGDGPQTGQIEYENTVSAGLSAQENLVLSQEGDLTVVKIEEGSATPYRRACEAVGLDIEQVAPAGPNESSSVNVQFQGRSANLLPGATTRIDTDNGSVEVRLLESFYTPVEELNGYREGDPYFISLVVTRIAGQ